MILIAITVIFSLTATVEGVIAMYTQSDDMLNLATTSSFYPVPSVGSSTSSYNITATLSSEIPIIHNTMDKFVLVGEVEIIHNTCQL